MRELLAKRVQTLRVQKRWSQMNLAKAAGVPQSTISDIESAKRIPRGDSLSKIALSLGTTTSYLLGEIEKAS
ncbi:helix-turn-helix protein [Hydrogenispora ethanolica]|jgi:transcriptional regulator with XRE-family HTH domain|uniref:Helix-turn-helix protein n=1 Tax=Hydrogenispora ethanolica TaxID=1082276 RepID=A0A4R1S4P0_HYDET|nr:helix-turn-helix transcriptional regulator [Hydrogenispora ethanolica]TCL74188.1 helix-turn-helix protein [Hydrogenispora ethanolica]